MKQYLIAMYQPDGPRPDAAFLEPIMRQLGELTAEMHDAGVFVFSGGLCPPDTATVIRVGDNGTLLTDGPFTEGKEHLGGFTVIRAEDLDAALKWGERIASITTLPIEVRPFQG